MADEFSALISCQSKPSLDVIAEVIGANKTYICERKSADEIAFRFSDHAGRNDWPEDFALNYKGSSLILTIHQATKHQRERIVGDIESAFGSRSISVEFQAI